LSYFRDFCFCSTSRCRPGTPPAPEIVDLGILSFRDLESTRRQWTPLADY
jgi:hypothetical protein